MTKKASTDWKAWYRSLSRDERIAYCERAGVSRDYLEVHLLFRRKNPRLETMQRLADASLGRVSREDVARFFING